MKKREIVIAGNWKMNKTPFEARVLAEAVRERCENAACKVVICVPFVDLFQAKEGLLGSSKIALGAQNVHWAPSGAFTGEISAEMLLSCGTEYVVIGHSERRQYFGETDESVNKRTLAALQAGLKPIVCVGETEREREEGLTESVIARQVKAALTDVDEAALENLIFAYEPVWAIGTGKTATSEQAEEVCRYLRDLVKELYSDAAADALTIQYGGSMNAKNAAELLSMPDIDGGLIGGASLKPDDFAVIVNAGSEKAARL